MTYQQIIVVGNVGKDAEIRYLRDGTAVANFSVAVSKVTGKGDQRQDHTTWFKVTVWRERAETVSQYVKKGMKVLVAGEVSASAYVDRKTNETRASLEVTAQTVQFLSRVNGDADTGPSGPPRDRTDTKADDEFGDDIPF